MAQNHSDTTTIHNAHVVKWCRFNCWLAMQLNKQLAQLHWATQERLERGITP